MQAISEFKEEWVVVVGKENFVLNEAQVKVLKDATTRGNRGIVWFNKVGISIPHIQAIYFSRKIPKNALTAGKSVDTYSEEDKRKARVKLDKMRGELGSKLKLKQNEKEK